MSTEEVEPQMETTRQKISSDLRGKHKYISVYQLNSCNADSTKKPWVKTNLVA